jgi:glycosyltransferase involved in cell wall biosynthesis
MAQNGLKIGIDASWACGKRSGTGNFTLDLVNTLTRSDNSNLYILYFRECCKIENPLYQISKGNVRKSVVDSRSTVYRILFPLSRVLKADRVDVFLSPAFFLPMYGSRRWLVTFFDLNIYTLWRQWARPGTFAGLFLMSILFPLSLRKADRIVSISTATQRDLSRIFPGSASKCIVIYPGLNLSRFGDTEHARTTNISPHLRHPFFLYVGNLSPTKNLERAIRAFAKFKEQDNKGFSFVLAGHDSAGYGIRTLRPLVTKVRMNEQVIFLGYVKDSQLAALYSQAYCLFYPSLREGFGYPILESMYFECPVITSNVSSCPEVGGDAAFYVDPLSEAELSHALEYITLNETRRKELVSKGKERWKAFSLDAMAANYLRLINQIGAL